MSGSDFALLHQSIQEETKQLLRLRIYTNNKGGGALRWLWEKNFEAMVFGTKNRTRRLILFCLKATGAYFRNKTRVYGLLIFK